MIMTSTKAKEFFSNTDLKTDLDGSFNLDLGMLSKLSFTYRDSDYSHTEQHAEEEEHGDDHGDDHDDHGDDHDDHGTITMIMVMNMPRRPNYLHQ